MAQRVKKKLTKKKASRSTPRKTVKKKTTQKKAKAKKAAKQPIHKKKAVRKQPAIAKESVLIKPGPPSLHLIPVEEPAANEEAIGIVTHYYSHLGVAIVQINTGLLATGMTIHVKGHTTDFIQQVESMEYEHHHVDEALPGQSVGIKVNDHAREHDIVFHVR